MGNCFAKRRFSSEPLEAMVRGFQLGALLVVANPSNTIGSFISVHDHDKQTTMGYKCLAVQDPDGFTTTHSHLVWAECSSGNRIYASDPCNLHPYPVPVNHHTDEWEVGVAFQDRTTRMGEPEEPTTIMNSGKCLEVGDLTAELHLEKDHPRKYYLARLEVCNPDLPAQQWVPSWWSDGGCVFDGCFHICNPASAGRERTCLQHSPLLGDEVVIAKSAYNMPGRFLLNNNATSEMV